MIETSKGRVFISGKMTGLSDYGYPNFHSAEARWRTYGWEVENPARNFDGDTSLPYPTYIRAALKQLLDCDAIVVLPGWEDSRGAKLEISVATALNMPIYNATDAQEAY